MTDLGRAGMYAAAWIPATVLAVAAESLAIAAFNATPVARSSSSAVTWALNLIPALLASLVVLLPVAYHLHRDGGVGSVAGHLVRGSILYILVFLLTLLLVASARNPDFGLFMQLLLWPAVAAFAGILADLLVWGFAGPSAARAA